MMDFCIMYLDPTKPPTLVSGAFPRYHIMTETGVQLFDTQAKAAAWIVKFGMDHIDYAVEPYHDLKGSLK